MESFNPSGHYFRVATACPEVAVSDVNVNIKRIMELYNRAEDQRASLVVFPELSVTGYSIGDLVQNTKLQEDAKNGLLHLAQGTEDKQAAMVVGLPLAYNNALYNCAAILASGEIKGIIPKRHLPTYNEFYEKRWYQEWDLPNTEIKIGGNNTVFGSSLLFDIGGVITGVEVCEDLWVADPPSRKLAEQGAMVIANPSASPELIGKSAYRRQLVGQQSARLMVGYLYAGCDSSESTMDTVMGGHQLIAESGQLVAERPPLVTDYRLIITDLDIDHISHDRLRTAALTNRVGTQVVSCPLERRQTDIKREVNRYPFLPPEQAADRRERLAAIVNIQATGLAQRMKNTAQEKLVLGLSGGLDSTLALMVAVNAAGQLGKIPGEVIRTLTMPGPASSDRTQNNARLLAKSLGIPNQIIRIGNLVEAQLNALDHDPGAQDVTFENIQARTRTSLLFNYGNKESAMVLGTGDLSEIALGWCTFNGDHMSHYNVNSSIPKTLVKHLVAYLANEPEFIDSKTVLEAILETPISPELTLASPGEISQKTEDIIGPYELHDFFLYHLIRWGDSPSKIRYLAEQAFKESYAPDEISKWLALFLKRFVSSQFKRSVMPDGPKVGSVALSPRGDWRMPSDAPKTALWQL